MKKLILVLCLVRSPVTAIGQASEFAGEWLLWLEQGNARRPAYGTLTIEPWGDSVSVYIDGGPVSLLARLDLHRVRRHQPDQRLARTRRRLGTGMCVAHAGACRWNARTIGPAPYDVKGASSYLSFASPCA